MGQWHYKKLLLGPSQLYTKIVYWTLNRFNVQSNKL